jgi:hypothetical protein
MFHPVDTKDRAQVEAAVQAAYLEVFPRAAQRAFVPEVFASIAECFEGRYPGYQRIDARYHDFEHTLQGALCMTRLLRGYHRAAAEPRVNERMWQLGLHAILLHDTGYLKRSGDDEGTGAKYTLTHVARSAEFAAVFLMQRGCTAAEVATVQHMIHCTGVNTHVRSIQFGTDLERRVGFALGTSDLLGQMAADDYIEKLPILFLEYAESARFFKDRTPPTARFDSAEDLVKKTPAFWERYVRPKINGDFDGMYRFLSDPYPDGPNAYIERIEANIQRLQQGLAGASLK